MYKVIMTVKEDRFSALGLDPCQLEDELDKVRGGRGGGQARWPGPESHQGPIHFPGEQGPYFRVSREGERRGIGPNLCPEVS